MLATTGNLEAVQQFLQAGASPDEQDEEGRTPLHFACGYGEMDCATAIIAAGANVNLVDNNRNTPLHYASGYGQAETAALLRQRCVCAKQGCRCTLQCSRASAARRMHSTFRAKMACAPTCARDEQCLMQSQTVHAKSPL